MTRTRTAGAALTVVVSWLIVCSSVARAGQDALVHAKDLYTSAAYDEALAALSAYQPSPDHAIEADEYRAFCLLALGRNADASEIIERIVTADPSFLPAENQASPRLQEAFHDVRQRVLPAIVRSAYADAKTSFDRKDFKTAARQFDRVLTLLKDPTAAASSDLTDFRTLSNGFLDLMNTASADTSPPPAVGAPTALPTPRIYGVDDEDVSPPVVISQMLPPWRPSKRETQTYEVAIVLLINEAGNVDSFRVEGNLHPSYNTQLRDAVRHWKYRPAMKDGTPVKFRKVVGIRLSPVDGSQSTTARR